VSEEFTPVSIAEARWDRCSRTDEQSVVDMLRAALAKIERGEIKPDHAFLCLGEVAAYRGVSTLTVAQTTIRLARWLI